MGYMAILEDRFGESKLKTKLCLPSTSGIPMARTWLTDVSYGLRKWVNKRFILLSAKGTILTDSVWDGVISLFKYTELCRAPTIFTKYKFEFC